VPSVTRVGRDQETLLDGLQGLPGHEVKVPQVFGAAEKYAGIEETLVDAHQKVMKCSVKMECTNARLLNYLYHMIM